MVYLISLISLTSLGLQIPDAYGESVLSSNADLSDLSMGWRDQIEDVYGKSDLISSCGLSDLSNLSDLSSASDPRCLVSVSPDL